MNDDLIDESLVEKPKVHVSTYLKKLRPWILFSMILFILVTTWEASFDPNLEGGGSLVFLASLAKSLPILIALVPLLSVATSLIIALFRFKKLDQYADRFNYSFYLLYFIICLILSVTTVLKISSQHL